MEISEKFSELQKDNIKSALADIFLRLYNKNTFDNWLKFDNLRFSEIYPILKLDFPEELYLINKFMDIDSNTSIENIYDNLELL